MNLVVTLRLSRLCLIILLSGCLGLSGCAMSGLDDPRLTPQQRALRQQAQEWNSTVATGIGAGVVAGAALGCVVNRYLYGRDCVRGAVTGGILGGAAGGALGQTVAARNAQLGAAAGGLESRLASARQANVQLEALTHVAERATAENQMKLAYLNQQFRAGQLTAAQFRNETETMRGDLAAIRSGANTADRARQEIAQGGPAAGIPLEDRKMQAARARLDRSADDLERALSVVPAA